jgi:2-polyprenyl-6-hydroxyphenyl methylase/3-demethylubiquinone-9 3-methyltransferase
MSEYEYQDPECTYASDYLLPILKELLAEFPAGSVVADAGCGNGSLLAALGRADWKMYGLEISESGLDQARAKYPQIQFHSIDLMQGVYMLPMTGNCDVVISTEVVEHVFLPRIFAKNCWYLLKSGGTLIISTPYHGYFKNLVLALSDKLDAHFTALWDYGHIKFWSKRTLTQLLRETGFEIRQVRGAGRVPYFWKSMIVVATKL